MRNIAAAFVAIVSWAGLAVQFSASYQNHHHVLATLWILARYFTIITNLFLALIMTGVAIGRRVPPLILGGLTIAILLVGLVYALLLQGLFHLSGSALVADVLLHKASPVLMVLWWLFYAPRAQLKWSAPLWWTLYPLAYFAYALVRGSVDHLYPYPFMDPGKLGWLQTALNAGGIASSFILAGFGLVWIDSWRPLGSSRGRS
ncbi:MAG TPA: Pr6Pr family membrane protein [Sphingomicrobium sp.]|nr:Pr6Pr family membrane protein [Sphingomicrobium sp.]